MYVCTIERFENRVLELNSAYQKRKTKRKRERERERERERKFRDNGVAVLLWKLCVYSPILELTIGILKLGYLPLLSKTYEIPIIDSPN